MYHAYNAPDQVEMVFRSDFGAALEEPSPRHFGRNYVAYWKRATCAWRRISVSS
jgi:hypothetical protein